VRTQLQLSGSRALHRLPADFVCPGAPSAAAVLYSCQSQVNEREAEGETEGEGGGKCACMHVCAHSPLTTPSSTSAAAWPPPLLTIVVIDDCRTQCGGCAVCWEECFAERGGGRSERRQ